MHATYSVIDGGGSGDAIPPLVSGGGGGTLPPVALPLPVIFSPCADTGATIDIPPTDVTAAAAKVIAATNNVAGIKTTNYIIVVLESFLFVDVLVHRC
jgi:hypothetical protein